MTCNVIATGSNGNAVLLGGNILIDCGVSFRKLEPYVRNLQVVLLTHIHSDHFKPRTLLRIHRQRPAVRFVCGPNLVTPLLDAGIEPYAVICANGSKAVWFRDGAPMGADNFSMDTSHEDRFFYPIPLVHDVENYGWMITAVEQTRDGPAPFRALYATDTRYIPRDCPCLDLYMVERNHTREELRQRQEARQAAGEFSHENVVAAVHMSAETIDQWLARNAGPHSQVVYLHGHKEDAC